MRFTSAVIALSLVTGSPPAAALDASDFDAVLGYTVVAVTQARGAFKGCEHDKRVRFENGWTLTCSEYSYNYSYGPDAVIFAKNFEHRGVKYWMLKVLIDDEFYDMQPMRAR
jgi:hypothetical protein